MPAVIISPRNSLLRGDPPHPPAYAASLWLSECRAPSSGGPVGLARSRLATPQLLRAAICACVCRASHRPSPHCFSSAFVACFGAPLVLVFFCLCSAQFPPLAPLAPAALEWLYVPLSLPPLRSRSSPSGTCGCPGRPACLFVHITVSLSGLPCSWIPCFLFLGPCPPFLLPRSRPLVGVGLPACAPTPGLFRRSHCPWVRTCAIPVLPLAYSALRDYLPLFPRLLSSSHLSSLFGVPQGLLLALPLPSFGALPGPWMSRLPPHSCFPSVSFRRRRLLPWSAFAFPVVVFWASYGFLSLCTAHSSFLPVIFCPQHLASSPA